MRKKDVVCVMFLDIEKMHSIPHITFTQIDRQRNIPCMGLSVCELTECSPRWVFCSRCRMTFSIFRSVVASKCPPMPAFDRSRNDSSVCVDLSTCRIVHDADMLQDGRRYRASKDAVRRIHNSVLFGFPAENRTFIVNHFTSLPIELFKTLQTFSIKCPWTSVSTVFGRNVPHWWR